MFLCSSCYSLLVYLFAAVSVESKLYEVCPLSVSHITMCLEFWTIPDSWKDLCKSSLDERVDRWMDGWAGGPMSGLAGWLDEWVSGWWRMGGWVSRWLDGSVGGWVGDLIHFILSFWDFPLVVFKLSLNILMQFLYVTESPPPAPSTPRQTNFSSTNNRTVWYNDFPEDRGLYFVKSLPSGFAISLLPLRMTILENSF